MIRIACSTFSVVHMQVRLTGPSALGAQPAPYEGRQDGQYSNTQTRPVAPTTPGGPVVGKPPPQMNQSPSQTGLLPHALLAPAALGSTVRATGRCTYEGAAQAPKLSVTF
jgi:hypothetical protein